MNNRYGTPKSEIARITDAGKIPILNVDILGAEAIKNSYPDALIIYIAPKAFADLEKRLVDRGSEDDQSLKIRLQNARETEQKIESGSVPIDIKIVNENLNETADNLKMIFEKAYLNPNEDKTWLDILKAPQDKPQAVSSEDV